MKKWATWLNRLFSGKSSSDVIDETGKESFPASDPPAWAASKKITSASFTADNNSNPFAQLKDEHKEIMRVIYLIHEQIEQLQLQQPANIEFLKMTIDFMHNFVEKCHLHKEEQFLFPALEQSKALLSECPLESFQQDHRLSSQLIRNLEKYVVLYSENPLTSRAPLIDTLTQLKNLYTQHTLKEENILFPIAEKHLTKSVQKSLFTAFQQMS